MGRSDLTASAGIQAIEEFDRIKRKAFLKKYRFGRARDYLLERNGRTYDSKAIAGAAHGFMPGQKPLIAKDFSGGEATVKKRLEELGFIVTKPEPPPLLSPGDVLTNAEISQRFGRGRHVGNETQYQTQFACSDFGPF